MDIKVIALASQDGWAYVQICEKIYLFKPPYIISNGDDIPLDIVKKDIGEYGFELCEFDFNDINEAISFIQNKYIEYKKSKGVGLPSTEQMMELIKYAPKEIILKIIKKANVELLSEGRIDEVETLLSKLKENKTTVEDTEIVVAMKQIRDAIRHRGKKIEDMKKILSSKYPQMTKEYSAEDVIGLQFKLSAKRQIFPIAVEG